MKSGAPDRVVIRETKQADLFEKNDVLYWNQLILEKSQTLDALRKI